jgi:hypothetical protein
MLNQPESSCFLFLLLQEGEEEQGRVCSTNVRARCHTNEDGREVCVVERTAKYYPYSPVNYT